MGLIQVLEFLCFFLFRCVVCCGVVVYDMISTLDFGHGGSTG